MLVEQVNLSCPNIPGKPAISYDFALMAGYIRAIDRALDPAKAPAAAAAVAVGVKVTPCVARLHG